MDIFWGPVFYQDLLELLLLALIRLLPPPLPGVLPRKHTHHGRSPWTERLSINQPTPDLQSNQVISLLFVLSVCLRRLLTNHLIEDVTAYFSL